MSLTELNRLSMEGLLGVPSQPVPHGVRNLSARDTSTKMMSKYSFGLLTKQRERKRKRKQGHIAS